MKPLRLLTILPLLALGALSVADDRIPIGKMGQALTSTAVYASPSKHARLFHHVKVNQRLVVRRSDNPDWDEVYLVNGSYGYTPASAIEELPLTCYLKVRSRSRATSSSRGSARTTVRTGSALANYAQTFTGTPYEWGGTDLSSGVDCSGFVKQIAAGAIGVNLPRTAAEQALVGMPITRLEDLRPGDRLYFYEKARGKIGHTGIYLGDGKFIHASHSKGAVNTDYLTASWRKILIAARR